MAKSTRLYSARPPVPAEVIEPVAGEEAPEQKEYVKPANHYIDNVEFYNEIVAFRAANWDRVVVQKLRPNIPNCLGAKILKICERLSLRFNFINYHFRQEMIDDAILNCINYIWNFDPEKSKSPFSYFTLVAHRAFVRRIQREKKQSDTKKRYAEHLRIDVGYDSMDRKSNADAELQADLDKAFYSDQSISSWGASGSDNMGVHIEED